MSTSFETHCILCGLAFRASEDAESERLKSRHMAAKHPEYELVKDWGWRRRQQLSNRES
jgi:hypothetical protein